MPAADQVLRVVSGWVEKAENDLDNAVHTLARGRGCPTDTVCFHAQQCAEKYLKAALALRGIDFPKSHDLGQLISHMPRGVRIVISPEEERRLTAYATVTRYPGDYEPISLAEARKAVALGRRIRRAVRKLLPQAALRRKRQRT